MEKEWKDIDGYDKYQCSSSGNIKNKLTGKILRQTLSPNGYLKVRLSKDGIARTCYIHKLVSNEFLNENPDKLYVNHKNGIKTDNNAENLEYVTPLENTTHAIESGLYNNAGENNGRSKLSDRDIPNIRRDLASGEYSQDEIAEKYNVGKNAISQIKLGTTWACITDSADLVACSRTKKKALEIRRLLNEKELSQAEIARQVDVSAATVSNIKSGKRWRGI